MVEGTGDYRPGVCGCCDGICKAASGVTNLWRPRCRVRLAGSKAVSTAVGELRRRLLEPLLVGRPTLRSTVMLAPAARSSDPLRPWRPARNSSSKRARRDAVIWRGAYRRDEFDVGEIVTRGVPIAFEFLPRSTKPPPNAMRCSFWLPTHYTHMYRPAHPGVRRRSRRWPTSKAARTC
jgi:hypothetical protein